MKYVTTSEAAALYGCDATTLTRMARRYGCRPRGTRTIHVSGNLYRNAYVWHPQDILNLRRKVRLAVARRRASRRSLSVAVRAKVRETAVQGWVRRYWLAKAQARTLNAGD